MAAQPKKKTSKVRSKTRRAHQLAKLPNLMVCPQCKTPKLPHLVCAECGYYGKAKLISTKLDDKIAKTLDKKPAAPKTAAKKTATKAKTEAKPTPKAAEKAPKPSSKKSDSKE